jgi:hypothetical protein
LAPKFLNKKSKKITLTSYSIKKKVHICMSNEYKTTTYYFFNYWFKSVTKGMVFFKIKNKDLPETEGFFMDKFQSLNVTNKNS